MVGGNPISDSHTIGTRINVPQTLMHSSNIVAAQIAQEVGGERMLDYLTQLGMAEPAYIELPARGAPLGMRDEWNASKAAYAGFGHGISVTPLHLASPMRRWSMAASGARQRCTGSNRGRRRAAAGCSAPAPARG